MYAINLILQSSAVHVKCLHLNYLSVLLVIQDHGYNHWISIPKIMNNYIIKCILRILTPIMRLIIISKIFPCPRCSDSPSHEIWPYQGTGAFPSISQYSHASSLSREWLSRTLVFLRIGHRSKSVSWHILNVGWI